MKKAGLIVVDELGSLCLFGAVISLLLGIISIRNHQPTQAYIAFGTAVLIFVLGLGLKWFVSKKAKQSFKGSLLEQLITYLLPPW